MGFSAWLYSVNILLPWWLTLPLNLVILAVSFVLWCAATLWQVILFFAGAFDPHSDGFLRTYIVNRWKEI